MCFSPFWHTWQHQGRKLYPKNWRICQVTSHLNHHYKSKLLPFISFITYTFCMCVFALSSFLAVDSVCLKVNSSIDLMMWIWGLKTESKKIPLGRAKTKVSLWKNSSVFDVSFKNDIKDYIKVSSERRKFPHFICNISPWAHKSSWHRIFPLTQTCLCTYMPCLYIFSLYYEYRVLHFLNDLTKPCILFHWRPCSETPCHSRLCSWLYVKLCFCTIKRHTSLLLNSRAVQHFNRNNLFLFPHFPMTGIAYTSC